MHIFQELVVTMYLWHNSLACQVATLKYRVVKDEKHEYEKTKTLS